MCNGFVEFELALVAADVAYFQAEWFLVGAFCPVPGVVFFAVLYDVA